MEVSSNERERIIAELHEYRSSACPSDQYGVLFGVEIATGITDDIIDTIANNACECSVNYLLQLGLSLQHCVPMCQIVTEILNS